MKNFITDYQNETKAKYELLWSKMYDLNANTENDFNNLSMLKNNLPKEIKEEHKLELVRLLENIEIKIKSYNQNLYEIKKDYDDFVINTSTYLKSLDSNPEIKGNMILQRNSLEQCLQEYYSYLKEGYNQIQTILNSLLSLFELIKEHIIADNNKSLNPEMIKDLIVEIVNQKIENVIPPKKFIDDNTSLQTQITIISQKINDIEDKFKNVYNKANEIQKNTDQIFSNINIKLKQLEEMGSCNKDVISKQSMSIADDLNNIRNQINTRIKTIENTLNNSIIKKF